MTQAIIYKQDSGVIAILYPTQEAFDLYGVQAIAVKDVPHGKPFAIIDSSLIPADRSMRNAWTVADSALVDGVGGLSNKFEVSHDHY